MTPSEKRQQLNTTIRAWLKERQELIVLYCSLCGINALSKAPEEEQIIPRLGRFCQILVDYLSAGHFEIFANILEEAEKQTDIANEHARSLLDTYPKIEASTPLLLDFNDTYDTQDHCQQALSKLPDQLSNIGEILTERFDLEDKLVAFHQQVDQAPNT